MINFDDLDDVPTFETPRTSAAVIDEEDAPMMPNAMPEVEPWEEEAPVAPAAVETVTTADLLNDPKEEAAVAEEISEIKKQRMAAKKSRLQRIAEGVGESVQALTRSPTDAIAAMKDGVIVKFHGKYWRGAQRLESGELALDVDPAMKALAVDRLRLGSKQLIPKELYATLQGAESAVRSALYNNSFRTSHGCFVPVTKFQAFREVYDAAKVDFQKGLDNLIARLPAIKADIHDRFAPLAHQAWRGARATWTEGGQFEEGHFTNEDTPTAAYLAKFLGKIEAEIPSAAEIIARAEFAYTLSVLQAPDTELASEFATSDPAVNAELREHLLKAKKTHIDNFIVNLNQGLLETVKKFSEEIAGRLGDKETAHGKTVNRVLSTIRNLREFNLLGDENVESQLSKLENFIEIKRATGKVSASDLKTEVASVMQNIINITEDAIKTVEINNPLIQVQVFED